MRRSNVIRIGPMVMFLLLVSSSASAQSELRVLRSAVVVEEPAGDANVVGTVVARELLELLDEDGSWYLVRRPENGAAPEWRTGWINGAMVEPLTADSTRRNSSSHTNSKPPEGFDQTDDTGPERFLLLSRHGNLSWVGAGEQWRRNFLARLWSWRSE